MGTRAVGTASDTRWEYACEVGVAIRKFVSYKPVIGM